MSEDQIDAVIAAFQKHLENGGPAPTLDHLTADEKKEAIEVLELMRDTRGVDFNRSRPSLDSLLSGLQRVDDLHDSSYAGLTLDAIRSHVVNALGSASEPIVDGAAVHEGIRSDVLVRYGSLRIRIQLRADLNHTSDLEDIDPGSAAGSVFGQLPDTAAVVLVINDKDFSSVAIGPFDVDDFIGAPDGDTHRARIVRPVLGLADTLRCLVDEFSLDVTDNDAIETVAAVDLSGIIRAECAAACDAVVIEGKKARTDAKVEAWSNFDANELLTKLLEDAAAGKLRDGELAARLTPAEAA